MVRKLKIDEKCLEHRKMIKYGENVKQTSTEMRYCSHSFRKNVDLKNATKSKNV